MIDFILNTNNRVAEKFNLSFRPFFYIIFFSNLLSCVPAEESVLASEAPEGPRFSIRFNTDYYTEKRLIVPLYELSSDNQISLRDCGIEKGTESVEDLYCILDLNEADIGVLGQAGEGIQLRLNVPREMCEYTTFQLPWHWNQPAGLGPPKLCKYTFEKENTGIEVNLGAGIPNGGNTNEEEESCYALADANRDCPSPPSNRNCTPGWTKIDDSDVSQKYCGIYDPTTDSSDSWRKNCCLGQYEVEEVGGDNNADNEFQDWGGDAKECIGGPARISDQTAWIEFRSIGELPTQTVFQTWTNGLGGEGDKVAIGPISEGEVKFTTVPTANYFNGIEDFLFTDYITGTVDQSIPNAFFPDYSKPLPEIRDSFGRIFPLIGYPYFTLSCLDSNYEVLHSVHLVIREWNTLDEFLSFKESNGRSGDPDITGEEGSGDCPYYEADEKLGRGDCNDFRDLDDLDNAIFPGKTDFREGYPDINYDGSS